MFETVIINSICTSVKDSHWQAVVKILEETIREVAKTQKNLPIKKQFGFHSTNSYIQYIKAIQLLLQSKITQGQNDWEACIYADFKKVFDMISP